LNDRGKNFSTEREGEMNAFWLNFCRNRNNRFWHPGLLFACLGLFFMVFSGPSGYAQRILGDPTGRSGEEPLPLPKDLPQTPPSLQIPLPQPPEEKGVPFHLPRIFVREIKITGNTVFSSEKLAEITAPYVNRELTDQDLESLRLALTVYYVNHGYINSGAIIPDQTVMNGIITLHIIEGKLTNIEVAGNRWFRTSYIRNRVNLGGGPPLNIYALQEQLQILQQDDRIQKLNAELKPDVKPGESLLKVQIQEENPLKIVLEFDNYQPPTVSSEGGIGRVTVTDQNLLGFGDIFSFTYGRSSGINPEIDIYYTIPFTAHDTSLMLYYRKNDFTVIESPFKNLDIVSNADIAGVTLRQPFYRTIHQEFALALTGEYINNRTFLDNEPFSFYPGMENGRAIVTALRFSQEWTYRALAQVIALRSRLSFGIDALGATVHSSGLPDSQFISWLLQAQWAMRHKFLDMQTILRMDLQLANKPLLAVEQIAVGGRYSVRGYRADLLVRDNGFIASLETRIPLIRNRPYADYLEFALFGDFGSAWNTDFPTPSPKSIGSIGPGLRWAASFKSPFVWKPQFEFYWGIPLKKVNTSGSTLQDHGIYFQFLIAAF
jgi:hemolysin activation/secretion protein